VLAALQRAQRSLLLLQWRLLQLAKEVSWVVRGEAARFDLVEPPPTPCTTGKADDKKAADAKKKAAKEESAAILDATITEGWPKGRRQVVHRTSR
jgi:hypothetical protein